MNKERERYSEKVMQKHWSIQKDKYRWNTETYTQANIEGIGKQAIPGQTGIQMVLSSSSSLFLQ